MFGLELNAKSLSIISIVSFTIGLLLDRFHNETCIWIRLHGKTVVEHKTYEIKCLDVYTNDISDDDEDSVGVAESTHL